MSGGSNLTLNDDLSLIGEDTHKSRDWSRAGGIAVVSTSPQFEQRLHSVLVANRGPSLLRWPVSAAESTSSVAAVFVGPDLPIESMIPMAEAIDREYPDVCVVLVAEPNPVMLEKALRAGVRDIVSPRATEGELVGVIDRAIEAWRRRYRAAATQVATRAATGNHRIIAVISPKGGVGKTFVSTNLALSLEERMPQQVVLVDLDLQFGDVSTALRLIPEHTAYDASRSELSKESTLIKVFLTPHESGLYVMCAPDDPAEADEITYEQSAQIVRLLGASFDTVLVDTCAGLDPHSLAIAEIATDIVFICSVDVASVRSVRKALDALDRLGMSAQRRHLVLNRTDAMGGARPEDVEVALGMQAAMKIPTDRAVLAAANQGTPIVRMDPRSAIARKFADFTQCFTEAPQPEQKSGGLSLPWRRSK